ncbi:MAG: D-glycero-beta-D-manno-heptose-7-phosphate kinase [Desulfovibrio sp.]|jgi:D-beta-D-heptose 7-phosphate kinase/D-beta-D-heptose 1-phosphate adenosyltransferase|nr:D-glycero-beta-D-manno-heptose-7-phosphate kinase [Desulfovibrio sp.]
MHDSSRRPRLDFAATQILVLGDVMLDEYIEVSVSRISPEAPVPVAVVRDRRHVPGGAANVARNLARLGCRVILAGLCGRDAAGAILTELLDREGVCHRLHAADGGLTIRKTRIIAQGQQMLRLDQEKPAELTQELYAALASVLRDTVPQCRAIILSDYAKGVLRRMPGERCLAQEVIALAAISGIPVCVDPKGDDWRRYAGAACVTPNAQEFEAEAGVFSGRAEMEAKAAGLRARYQFERLLVTRGGKGMALFENGVPPLHIKAKAREVIDVSGAGDTVVAVLAACLAAGLGWAEAADFANMAAGVVVSKAGTSPITREEFDALLAPGESSPKIMREACLFDMLASWRNAGDSIVFTNGCFDLLHRGHVRLINEAAAQGDRLVVALNSDASARRLKGPGRPVQDAQSRALLIAAMEKVDAVVFFDDDTPCALIGKIMPEVLVKGGNYTPQTVEGAETVVAGGGRVHLVELVEDAGAMGLISRIRQDM